MLDFTTPQTVWVVAAAVVRQSHDPLNRRTLVAASKIIILFLDLDITRIKCRCTMNEESFDTS